TGPTGPSCGRRTWSRQGGDENAIREESMRISEFIERCNRETSREGILSLMQRAARDYGFDRYAYCALTDRDLYVASRQPAPAVELNYPSTWTRHYFANGYQGIDPVIAHAPLVDRPFLWDSLGARCRLSQRQKRVMSQAREAKLRDGVAVPLHGPFGSCWLLTFAAVEGHPDAELYLPRLAVLSTQFHLAYSDIVDARPRKPVPELSRRERECLQWLAGGKSRWEIGQILRISENTVRFHVKNAFRKLEANNRIVAVVKALRYRLISLADGENHPFG